MINNTIVQELIHEIVKEEEGVPVVECLMEGSITDEEIAEKTHLKLNTVRKILYKLYDAGIASYKRSKDPETQWYTYTWKFESEKIEEIIKKRNQEIIENLREMLAFEENNMFFACKNGHYRYTFDEAAENNFRCPECQEELEYMDNSEIIQQLKRELSLYENNGSEIAFNFKSYS
ncbi:MAG TPA: transcription factor E [Methanothermobacter sp.]|nr:transcription initiation factor IIE, alpha subunit [Methanothermobacter sp. MT-2]HHW04429.1 transcription factor E [Methanothermobacter sp.]HOK72991.1 transcription factor E [Methanothermobacter sp.]HOL69297.1 transcription factor E [Methanothermobacter sp.]HPQ04515.1 transcription factor E [Methanothermobacter sp.]